MSPTTTQSPRSHRRPRVAAVAVHGVGAALALVASVALGGCGRVPSPLAPARAGSIGLCHRGVLTNAVALAPAGEGYALLRANDRAYGLPRFVDALARAARTVARERPGGTLVFGDLSAEHGGAVMPHFSHRSGRDADALFYVTTLEGAPVVSPGFVHVGPDGLAWDPSAQRFLRLDVEREWLFVKTLVEDPAARVQWLFINHVVESMLIDWARARGESTDTVLRAALVMAEPHPGGAHDDHIHVRTTCSAEERAAGCEPSGAARAWLADPEPPASVLASGASGASGDARADAEALIVAFLAPIAPPPSDAPELLPWPDGFAPARPEGPPLPATPPALAGAGLPLARR